MKINMPCRWATGIPIVLLGLVGAVAAAAQMPAVFLGTLDQIGTVAAGEDADLILLTKNPLEDVGNIAM